MRRRPAGLADRVRRPERVLAAARAARRRRVATARRGGASGQANHVRRGPGHDARRPTTGRIRSSARRTEPSGGCAPGWASAPRLIGGVLGVAKAYTTRVGAGPVAHRAPRQVRRRAARERRGVRRHRPGRPRRCRLVRRGRRALRRAGERSRGAGADQARRPGRAARGEDLHALPLRRGGAHQRAREHAAARELRAGARDAAGLVAPGPPGCAASTICRTRPCATSSASRRSPASRSPWSRPAPTGTTRLSGTTQSSAAGSPDGGLLRVRSTSRPQPTHWRSRSSAGMRGSKRRSPHCALRAAEDDCRGHWIKATVNADGRGYTLSNGRNRG